VSQNQTAGHERFEQELTPSNSLCRLGVIGAFHLSVNGLADENYIPRLLIRVTV